MKNVLITLCFLLMMGDGFSQSIADTIILNSGAVYVYDIIKEDDKNIYIKRDGKNRKVQKQAIKEIKRGQDPYFIIDYKNQKVFMSKVITIEGFTKDQLYNYSREWMADAFKSATDVIQYEDKDAGKIVGKGKFSDALVSDVWFTIRIQTKNNKVRFVIENLYSKTNTAYSKETPIEFYYWKNDGTVRGGFYDAYRQAIYDATTNTVMHYEEAIKQLAAKDNW